MFDIFVYRCGLSLNERHALFRVTNKFHGVTITAREAEPQFRIWMMMVMHRCCWFLFKITFVLVKVTKESTTPRSLVLFYSLSQISIYHNQGVLDSTLRFRTLVKWHVYYILNQPQDFYHITCLTIRLFMAIGAVFPSINDPITPRWLCIIVTITRYIIFF